MDNLLQTITNLSHEFGTERYVRGGGGNSSAKNAETLWVKPSGTILLTIDSEDFVAVNREGIDRLYDAAPPSDPTAREAMVKEKMEEALCPGQTGRPSVEAPLHNTFEAKYVVHTHPALVSGLMCANDSQAECARLYPDALWIEYVDPGFTLCMVVRERINAWTAKYGEEPGIVFLQNHGVFIAGDTVDEIRERYASVMDPLEKAYANAGIAIDVPAGDAPVQDVTETITMLKTLLGEEHAAVIKTSGPFAAAPGPLSPDHVVYSKAYILIGEATEESVRAFEKEHGYPPKVIATKDAVYGLGGSEKNAALALELARDAALVLRLTEAFGGVSYMSKQNADFIENWEVESYRRKQIG